MNQILQIKTEPKKFKLTIISFLLILILLSVLIFYLISSIYNKNITQKYLSKNYSVYKIYSKKNITSSTTDIIGTIKIPTINLELPIFKRLTTHNLTIAPCVINGTISSKTGNLSIAGHNHENNTLFSDLNKLKIDNYIYLYDFKNSEYKFKINKIYEVYPNDLTPLSSSEKEKELTLITCNNLNQKRLIIKSKIES